MPRKQMMTKRDILRAKNLHRFRGRFRYASAQIMKMDCSARAVGRRARLLFSVYPAVAPHPYRRILRNLRPRLFLLSNKSPSLHTFILRPWFCRFCFSLLRFQIRSCFFVCIYFRCMIELELHPTSAPALLHLFPAQ